MLLMIVIVAGVLQSAVTDIVTGPTDRTAAAGDTVVFHCSTESATDNLIWMKYGRQRHQVIYNGATKKISDAKKYNVSTNDHINYSLTIYAVEAADGTPYSCTTMTLTDEKFANLVVILSLTASLNPSELVAVGDTANVTCEVIYGGPSIDDSNNALSLGQAPYMNVYISGHDVTSSAIITISTNQQATNKSWTVNHTLVHEDVNSELQCTVSSQPNFEKDVAIGLNISAPTSEVNVDNNSTTHKINEMVGCSGDGNPPPKVEWKPVHPWNGSNDGPDGPGWAKLHLKNPGKNMWNCTASNTVISKDGSVKQNEAFQVVEFIVIEREVPSEASTRLAIGLGVGLGLGILVIIILLVVVILLMMKRKKQKNEKGMAAAQPPYAINAYPNPSMYYTTPILPQQVAQSQQKVVGGTPGVPDLGVRHLGGSRSSLQLNQSFDNTEKREFQPTMQFKGGHADVGQSVPTAIA